MVSKITISLSSEIDAVLSTLAKENGEPKSRLIEAFVRENPTVQAQLGEYRTRQAHKCSQCGQPFHEDDVRIYSPKLGIAKHVDCWSKEAGEAVEEYALHGQD